MTYYCPNNIIQNGQEDLMKIDGTWRFKLKIDHNREKQLLVKNKEKQKAKNTHIIEIKHAKLIISVKNWELISYWIRNKALWTL